MIRLFIILFIHLLLVYSFPQFEENGEDSLNTKEYKYNLTSMNNRIGINGLSLFTSFIKQTYKYNESDPKPYSFGFGFTGDVLTGINFIHLIPVFSYWQYSKKYTDRWYNKITYRDIGLSFNTTLMSKRFSSKKIRVFIGGGPSIHLNLLTYYSIVKSDPEAQEYNSQKDDNKGMQSFLRTGLGVLTGGELPLTGTISFIVLLQYRHVFNWDTLNKKFFSISAGITI